jgi:hypothetical protein
MSTEATNTKIPAIESLVLKHGHHNNRDEGVCLLEAVAWFAGEPHSDHPECTDVALGAYGRALNDRMRTDEERAPLRPLIPRLVGTRGSSKLATRRAYFVVDRYLRQDLPAWFRELPFKPRPDIAERLEALPPVIDGTSANRARDLAREIRTELRRSISADAAYAAYAAAAAAAAAYAAYAYAYDAYAAAAAADAAAYAYAYDAAAYAYDAAAYAAYAAAAAADAAYDAAADAAYDAAEFKALREKTLARAIATFEAAIEITEAS